MQFYAGSHSEVFKEMLEYTKSSVRARIII